MVNLKLIYVLVHEKLQIVYCKSKNIKIVYKPINIIYIII